MTKIHDEEETVLRRRSEITLPGGVDESFAPSAKAGDDAAEGRETKPELTIFLPVYNEEPNLAPLHIKIDETLAQLSRSAEIIYIDDGSTDNSLDEMRRLAAHDRRVRVIALRRNFGKMAAMVAGIDAARGEVLIAMDADLQNDPEDIPRLLDKLEEGYDVVSGWRIKRQDAQWTRKVPSQIANRVISWASGVQLHDYGCCLKAYRREALEGVKFYGEMHRFIPIYAAHQAGARVAELPVKHHPRRAGVSKFGKLSRTFEVLLDLITIKFMEDYRTKPMHFFGMTGFIALAISILSLLLALVFKLTGTNFFATSLPTIAFVAFAFAVQFVFFGLIAEMLMRTYYESQNKPTYIVRELIGFDDKRRAGRQAEERLNVGAEESVTNEMVAGKRKVASGF